MDRLNQAPGVAARPAYTVATEKLEKEIVGLVETAQALEHRLNRFRSIQPQAPEKNPGDIRKTGSEETERLFHFAQDINGVNRRLDDLLQELDI